MNRKIKKVMGLITFFVYNRVGILFMKMDNMKVIFLSENRETLSGNLKMVYEKLPDNYSKKVYVKGDRRDSMPLKVLFSLWKDLTTARYIILDDYYGLVTSLKVRKGQEIVQLWHGCGAYKKFGFSRIGTGDKITRVHDGYRKYTKAIVTAEPIRCCFAEAFDIDIEKVQAMGSPRVDVFFDETAKKEIEKKVYSHYPQLKKKKIVLIAPTYRGRKVEDAAYDFEKLNITNLVKELGGDYQVVVKWHPALYNNIKRGICKFDNQEVIDASSYSDINELLVVSDILVTDYSSVIFDWFLLNKPIVYFAYDLDEYRLGRGLYYDFDEYIYGNIATNYEELIKEIRAEDLLPEKRKAFGEKFMSACDGKSTKKVIDWIFSKKY